MRSEGREIAHCSGLNCEPSKRRATLGRRRVGVGGCCPRREGTQDPDPGRRAPPAASVGFPGGGRSGGRAGAQLERKGPRMEGGREGGRSRKGGQGKKWGQGRTQRHPVDLGNTGPGREQRAKVKVPACPLPRPGPPGPPAGTL